VGLGLHADFPAALRAMTRMARMVEPGVAHAALVDHLDRQVDRRMSPRLEPLHARIRAVTGCPSSDRTVGCRRVRAVFVKEQRR
jgi:hypothetical protein